MAEDVSTSIENNNPQNLKKEDIITLLNKFEKSDNSDDFDIDGNSEISEKEIEIKKQLSQIQDKVGFLKGLLIKIEQKQNINKQNTGTESKETNPSLLNKELKDYTPEEAKEGLKYLQDNYQSYKRGEGVDGEINDNIKISEIKNSHDAYLFQKKLINKIDPVLFKNGFTDTHIRGSNLIKGEYIISIEDFRTKLNNPNTKLTGSRHDGNVVTYMEMLRYLRYIEHKEEPNFNFDEIDDKDNSKILKKYLPKHILDTFLVDWEKQVKKYDLVGGYMESGDDEIKEGENEIISNKTTSEEQKKLMLYFKEGYTREEALEMILKNNKGLKIELEKYKETHKKYYENEKKQIEEDKKEEKNNQIKNKTNTNSDSGTEIYTQTNNGYIITAPNGEEIRISEKEKNITFGRPEALKNLINFHNFFEELNLLGAWDYREDLMLAIGDIYINPNDGDSIKKEELRKYGNELLTFISNIENKGKGKKFDLQNLNSVKRELRKFSGSNSMLSKSKTHNIQGEDKLTAYLRSEGIIGEAYFKTNEFRENLIA